MQITLQNTSFTGTVRKHLRCIGYHAYARIFPKRTYGSGRVVCEQYEARFVQRDHR